VRARLLATCLVLEAFVVFFATLAAFALSPLPAATVWTAGLTLVAVCLVAAGLVRRPAGVGAGWAVQVLVLASAVVVPAMAVLGVLFAALYGWFVVLGGRIDRDRAAHEALTGDADDDQPPGRTSPVS
jgi:hypothetical protein